MIRLTLGSLTNCIFRSEELWTQDKKRKCSWLEATLAPLSIPTFSKILADGSESEKEAIKSCERNFVKDD
jgi:hypothetical protein